MTSEEMNGRRSKVSEAGAAYSVQLHTHTMQDYLALPDDIRVELIDGTFYNMSSPTSIHQNIAGYIYRRLCDHVEQNKGNCMPMISPIDVQLDRDEWTIVQPDVLIICDRSKITRQRIVGAPDFVLEILSPSTMIKDMTLKLWKYYNAGVREYWILDPDKQIVLQYDLGSGILPKEYTRSDSVPVLIWDKQFEIRLTEVFEYVDFLYD